MCLIEAFGCFFSFLFLNYISEWFKINFENSKNMNYLRIIYLFGVLYIFEKNIFLTEILLEYYFLFFSVMSLVWVDWAWVNLVRRMFHCWPGLILPRAPDSMKLIMLDLKLKLGRLLKLELLVKLEIEWLIFCRNFFNDADLLCFT